MNRRDLIKRGFSTGLVGFSPPLFAQTNYPNKPITMIVPFPPGGVTDLVARELAKRITEAFGQACTVENKAGAGGNIGTAALARSSPDGYTLGVMTVSAISIAPHVTPNLPFNPEKDFTPITNIVNTPGALLAGIKTSFQSILMFPTKVLPLQCKTCSLGSWIYPLKVRLLIRSVMQQLESYESWRPQDRSVRPFLPMFQRFMRFTQDSLRKAGLAFSVRLVYRNQL